MCFAIEHSDYILNQVQTYFGHGIDRMRSDYVTMDALLVAMRLYHFVMPAELSYGHSFLATPFGNLAWSQTYLTLLHWEVDKEGSGRDSGDTSPYINRRTTSPIPISRITHT